MLTKWLYDNKMALRVVSSTGGDDRPGAGGCGPRQVEVKPSPSPAR